MRRLLIATVVLTASMLLPTAAIADSPHHVILVEGEGLLNLALFPALACLGSQGSFRNTFDHTGDHDAKVFEPTRRNWPMSTGGSWLMPGLTAALLENQIPRSTPGRSSTG